MRSAPLFADEDHEQYKDGNKQDTHDDIDSFGLLIAFFHEVRYFVLILHKRGLTQKGLLFFKRQGLIIFGRLYSIDLFLCYNPKVQ